MRDWLRQVRYWPRERRLALYFLTSLAAASLVLWVALMLMTEDLTTRVMTENAVEASRQAVEQAEEPEESDAAEESDEAEESDGSDEADSDGEAQPVPEDRDADHDRADLLAEQGASDPFDGTCDDGEPAGQEPWQQDGCEYAPVDPTPPRWIVVKASMAIDEYSETAAHARAERDDGELLFSSYYPSLNPDLWVVYDGPFPSRDAAIEAAQSAGGGAYPRLLSTEG